MSIGFYSSNGQFNPHGGTPDDLLNELIEEFGELFDPCPNNPQFDGLDIAWPLDKWVYCNPPYTRGLISKWVQKCYDEWRRGCKIILLIPAYTDTAYFWDYIHDFAKVRFIRGRLKFKGYGGKTASFPSILCIFDEEEEK